MAARDDSRTGARRPPRAAYALPTLFTAGNIFLGYLSILRSFKGAMAAASGRSCRWTLRRGMCTWRTWRFRACGTTRPGDD